MTTPLNRVGRIQKALLGIGLTATAVGLGWDVAHGEAPSFGPDQLALIGVGGLLVAISLLLARSTGGSVLSLNEGRLTGHIRSDPVLRPGMLPRLGLWSGLVLGLVESLRYAVLAGPGAWMHTLWLVPATYGAFYAIVAGGIALFGMRTADRASALRLTIGVPIFGATASWLFMLAPRLHFAAVALLSLGTAWRAAPVLVRHLSILDAIFRRSERFVAAVVAVLAVGSFASDAYRIHRTTDALPDAAPDARNVILIVLDTVRSKSLSLFGYERRTTPNLERWAQRGVVFSTAVSTAPWTLPSHAGMFTGRWAYELSTDWSSPLDEEFPTVAEALAERGYLTAGFVANLGYTNRSTGLSRGFAHYEDFEVSFWQAVISTSLGREIVTNSSLRNVIGLHEVETRKRAREISDDFLDWLSAQGHDRPFFAFLNYFDAHEP